MKPKPRRAVQQTKLWPAPVIVFTGMLVQFAIWLTAIGTLLPSPTFEPVEPPSSTPTVTVKPPKLPTARQALQELSVSELQLPGYRRARFGQAWVDVDRNGCDQRNDVLRRDLQEMKTRPGSRGCAVAAGRLDDPYTQGGPDVALPDVEIDHVVSLSDGWKTGGGYWTAAKLEQFANDPLNLLATSGQANREKGSQSAATWLPDDEYVCPFVARQIAVKTKYRLTVTRAEKRAMLVTLQDCPADLRPTSIFDAVVVIPEPVGE